MHASDPRRLPTSAIDTLELLNSQTSGLARQGILEILHSNGFEKLSSFCGGHQTRWTLPHRVELKAHMTEKKLPKKRAYIKGNVVWVESKGRLDLNKSSQKKGFKFIKSIEVRTVEPQRSSLAKLPTNSELAIAMAPHAEFEISGDAEIGFSVEYAAEARVGRKTNLSILTRKLEAPNQVLVQLKDTLGSKASVGYYYQQQQDPSTSSLAQFFGRIWHFLVDKFEFLTWLSRSSANAEIKKESQNRTIRQYVLDLSIPEHAQAYDEIFSRFSMTKVESVATKQEILEKESSYDFNIGGTLGDDEFRLVYSSESEKESVSKTRRYLQSTSIQEHLSKWWSKISVAWEWVSLDNLRNKTSRSYCHLKFESPNVTQFFALTNALEIFLVDEAKEVFKSDPESTVQLELFYTEAGIKKIQNVSFREAFKAYLGEEAGLIINCEAAKRYGEILNKSFMTRWFFAGELSELEERYPGLAKISDKLAEAYSFAKNLGPFKGSLRRFSDCESIIALTRMAGRDNLMVHELSITGQGMSLVAPDEGEIQNPETDFIQQLEVSLSASSPNAGQVGGSAGRSLRPAA